jgi:3-oxoadipate CoA-transferase beta subunit
MMDLLTKQGESKLVGACTYPLTGLACVSRVYTDLGVFDVGPQGAFVVETVDGVSIDDLRKLTGVSLAA